MRVRYFNMLVTGYGQDSFGKTIASMIRREFSGGCVSFVDQPMRALEIFKKFNYQIVACDFYLGIDDYTGVDFLLEAKRCYPETKTVLLTKNFRDEYSAIKLDTLKLLRAVDCVWQKEPYQRAPLSAEKIIATIGGLLQNKQYPLINVLAYFRSRA